MSTRLRLFILALFAVVSFVLAPSPAGTDGISSADGPCPTGTNWDDATHTCR